MSDLRNADEDREHRHHRHDGGAWVGGAILIGIGAIFLARNMGMPLPENWWALFLLIPAIGSLATAIRVYNRAGELNGAVAGSLFGAAIFFGLMLLFLLEVDINWDMLWPVILIVVGLAILVRSYWRRI